MPLRLYILVSLFIIVYFVQLDWNPDFSSIKLLYNQFCKVDLCKPGLEIVTDTVANATNIFSLATKNSSLVAKVATRFLYDLDLK